MYAILFPNLDPVALSFGSVEIRWYGIAYVAGILLGWLYSKSILKRYPSQIQPKDLDDFMIWATVGIVAGGRLGYALFYQPSFYLSNPLKLFYLWQPGMSFHGGLSGVIIALIWFCRRHKLPVLAFADIIASVAPIGLFFGRIANFINAELYGRITEKPWGVIFPTGGPHPRHPSQLYEAALEGIALFFLLFSLEHFTRRLQSSPGFMTAIFLLGYAAARIFVEMYREPEAHLDYFTAALTFGQLLCVPLILAGMLLVYFSVRHKKNNN